MCTIVLCMGALEYDNKQSSVEKNIHVPQECVFTPTCGDNSVQV